MTSKLYIKLNNQILQIDQDNNRLYCLNDLYKASGGDDSKKPSKWLRYKKWLEVVDPESKTVIKDCDDLDSFVTVTGKGRGSKTFGSFKTAVKYLNFLGFHINAEGVFEKEDKPKDECGYLYVIENSQGLIKIGISRNPDKRLQLIQTACGYKCNLLYTQYIPEGVYNLEQNLHWYYKDFRTFGEWFDLEDRNSLIDTVTEVVEAYMQKDEIILYSALGVTDKASTTPLDFSSNFIETAMKALV